MFWSIVRWLISAAVMIGIFLIMQSFPTFAAITVCILLLVLDSAQNQINSLENRLRQKEDEMERICTGFDKKRRELELRIERLTN